jgi:hypothetical protein
VIREVVLECVSWEFRHDFCPGFVRNLVAIYIPSCVVHVVVCFLSSESILQAEQGYVICSYMKVYRQLRYFYIAQ